jgi:hypothetical protein
MIGLILAAPFAVIVLWIVGARLVARWHRWRDPWPR